MAIKPPTTVRGKIMAKNTAAAVAQTASENSGFKRPEGLDSGGGLEFIRPAKLAEDGITGVILEGVYVGTLPNKFNETKPDYKFQKENGDTVVLNSAGNLQYQMKAVSIGTLTQISYLGKQKITKGAMAGKESHNFEVLVG